MKIKELRPRHVEAWVKSRPGVKKPGTERQYKAMILAALNWAAGKKVRLIVANPLKGLIESPEGGSRGGEVLWTPQVFQAVLANVNERFGEFLRVVAWTGARPSTIRRVEARHYRRDLAVWDVSDLGRGKKKQRRTWLTPELVELIERLNAEHPVGPIFRNTVGKPYSGDVVTMAMFTGRCAAKVTLVVTSTRLGQRRIEPNEVSGEGDRQPGETPRATLPGVADPIV